MGLGSGMIVSSDVLILTNKQPVPDVNTFANTFETLPHDQKVKLLALDHRTGNTGYVQGEVN
jgi:hypothetical protein